MNNSQITSPLPKPEDYQKYSSHHLCHEVAAFFLASYHLNECKKCDSADVEKKREQLLAFTTFFVKARLLSDFFYPNEKPRPDDILAYHFYKTREEWENSYQQKYDTSPLGDKSERDRINKEILHLTTSRKPFDQQTPWANQKRLTEQFLDILEMFYRDASPEHLAKKKLRTVLNNSDLRVKEIVLEACGSEKIAVANVAGADVEAQTMTMHTPSSKLE